MLTLYKSMVRSHLEFACPVWNGLSQNDVIEIESIQRSFTNKIICPNQIQNYLERLEYLNLMSLQRRRERYTILHMWKILNKKTSNDINIVFTSSNRFGKQALIPALNSSNQKAQTLYDSSFAVKGPQLWNTLPVNIKHMTSLNSFKIEFDKFLKKFPDQPPTNGYSSSNNNSILEWRFPGQF